MLNLLDNAIKYNWDDGEIMVAAHRRKGNLIVTVANRGPGIPAEQASKLFDRFYRYDPQRSAAGQGLGLSLARELARAHGGSLELTSSGREWTVFTLQVLALDEAADEIGHRKTISAATGILKSSTPLES